MRDLQLVDLTEDGSHLVLTVRGDDAGGQEQFRLPVDDRLSAAVHGDRAGLAQRPGAGGETVLRPAEIQARIRAGASAEEVARESGMTLAKVRRYEGPVLAERAHMVRLARSCSPRRTDGSAHDGRTLEDLVVGRLDGRGVDLEAVQWDAARLSDGCWRITVDYPLGAGTQRAVWHLDPRDRVVVAQDDHGRWLCGEETPGPRRLPDLAAEGTGAEAAQSGEDLPPGARGPHSEAHELVEPEQVTEELLPAHEAVVGGDETFPLDVGEVARGAARSAREARKAESAPRHASGRSRRASVPSWDDIVFGARTRE